MASSNYGLPVLICGKDESFADTIKDRLEPQYTVLSRISSPDHVVRAIPEFIEYCKDEGVGRPAVIFIPGEGGYTSDELDDMRDNVLLRLEDNGLPDVPWLVPDPRDRARVEKARQDISEDIWKDHIHNCVMKQLHELGHAPGKGGMPSDAKQWYVYSIL